MSTQLLAHFAEFIAAAPSSFHAAAEVTRQLEAAGFDRTTLAARDTPRRGVLERDGAVVAWIVPDGASAESSYRIIGAHTDSPGFVLKPNATLQSNGYLQLGVEIYGGPLLNSWLDRELEIAGRLVLRDGGVHLVRSGPAVRIPQLAIHLDREVNAGLTLDKQRHTVPLWGSAAGSAEAGADFVAELAASAGLNPTELAGYDLITVDSAPPARFGRGGELFAAPRLDNLSSVFAGMRAMLAASERTGGNEVLVFAAFTHEEVGSETPTGALGPLLARTLDRLAELRGADAAAERAARANSWLISADAGHGVHPNYPEKHDPNVRPVLGGGPLLKLNANARYATDGLGAAMWQRCLDGASVTGQAFVSNNTIPCGSTIGPLAATKLGIRTLDVGIPLLSMHSARELCHVGDVPALTAALGAFYAGA